MKIEYHPLTVDDLAKAEIYYEEQQVELSQVFRTEVLQAIGRINDNPFLYAEVGGVLRALMKRFPFSILYRVLSDDTIRILLIRHHKRHPTFESERR